MISASFSDLRRPRAVGALGAVLLVSGVLAGCAESAGPDTSASGVVQRPVVGGSVDDAYLIMPHRSVQLTGSEVSPTLDELTVRSLDLGTGELDAADGQEFLELSIEPAAAPYKPDGSTKVEVQTTQGSHDITADVDGATTSINHVHIAVSVPKDSPVTLAITDDGKTASLDARTGERTEETDSDSTAAYYLGWGGQISGDLESTGALGPISPYLSEIFEPDEVSIMIGLDGREPSAHGWLTGAGWAPEGQAFLVLTDVSLVTSLAALPGCGASWDPATSLAFTPDGGEPAPPLAVASGGDGLDFDLDSGMAFQIPLDTTSGVLTLTPQATANDECQFYEPMSAVEVAISLT